MLIFALLWISGKIAPFSSSSSSQFAAIRSLLFFERRDRWFLLPDEDQISALRCASFSRFLIGCPVSLTTPSRPISALEKGRAGWFSSARSKYLFECRDRDALPRRVPRFLRCFLLMFFKGMGSPRCRSNTITSTNLLFSYLLTNRELLNAINASYGITRFAAKLITGIECRSEVDRRLDFECARNNAKVFYLAVIEISIMYEGELWNNANDVEADFNLCRSCFWNHDRILLHLRVTCFEISKYHLTWNKTGCFWFCFLPRNFCFGWNFTFAWILWTLCRLFLVYDWKF